MRLSNAALVPVLSALVLVATTLLWWRYAKKERYVDPLEAKYPHWGWGSNAGLRCSKNDNTGCNTTWVNGKLVEKVNCVAPKSWQKDQCLCTDPLKEDTARGWCTGCKAPFVMNSSGTCVCPDGKEWRDNQCLPPVVKCVAPKSWQKDQCLCTDPLKEDTARGWCTGCKAPFVMDSNGTCVCPDGKEWRDNQCLPKLPQRDPNALPDFTWDQRVRQCEMIGNLMQFGKGKAYVCKTNPNIRKGKDYAWDIEWQCCKNTNYDCHNSGIGGIWQAASQAGLKPSGYWTEDDGCNLDVFGLDGAEIAVNKISGLWKANPLIAFNQGNILGGLTGLPFMPPAFKLAAKGAGAAGLGGGDS